MFRIFRPNKQQSRKQSGANAALVATIADTSANAPGSNVAPSSASGGSAQIVSTQPSRATTSSTENTTSATAPATSTAPAQNSSAPPQTEEQLAAAREIGVMNITNRAQFDTLLDQVERKHLLLEFHAKWCAACKLVHDKVEELAQAYADKITVARIDIDDLLEVAIEYEVKVIPSFVMVKEKEVLETCRGGNETKLEGLVRKYGGDPTALPPHSQNNNNENNN